MNARTRIILAVGAAALIAVLLAVAAPTGTVTAVAVLLATAIGIFPSDRPCAAEFTGEDHDTLTCARTGLHITHCTDDGTQFLRVPGGARITEPTP